MSNELRGATGTGESCYALILNSSGKFWNGSAFETYSASNYNNYDVAMAEVGSSGIYLGSFPVGITSSGTYEYFVKRIAQGSQAEDDPIVNTGSIDWTGTTVVSAGAGSLSGTDWYAYVLRGGFKRTDKETEVYEETTDAVQEMRRRFMFDEAKAETITTDTISILGDYRLALESDFGLLLGVTVEDGGDATPLIQLTKHEFNQKYPDINVTADRGYPLDFCVYGGAIQIGPIPDRVIFSYRVAYSTRGGIITSATTGVPFTSTYRDILRDNVLGRLYMLMDDFEKASIYKQSFENGFIYASRKERTNSGEGNFNVKPFGM
jgi:hypothetical protein